MRPLVALSFLFLACASAAAQQVSLRGKVENTANPNVFVIDCTSVSLTSGTPLLPFVGQQVLLSGAWNGSAAAPAIAVDAIALTPESFEIPSNPKIGGTLRFKANGTPGDLATFFAAPAAGFLPLGANGSLLIDPLTAFQAAKGVIGPLGFVERSVALPNDPALVGIVAHAQALIVSGQDWLLSNADCKPIQN